MKLLIFIPILLGLSVHIPVSNNITPYEQRLYELHNEYRTAHKLKPLTWDYQLEESARKKNNAMLECYEKTGEIYHECPGENKGKRGIDDNPDVWQFYPPQYKQLGENLSVGFLTPDEAFDALLHSKLHYDNIVNDFTTYAVSCTTHNLCTHSFKR